MKILRELKGEQNQSLYIDPDLVIAFEEINDRPGFYKIYCQNYPVPLIAKGNLDSNGFRRDMKETGVADLVKR